MTAFKLPYTFSLLRHTPHQGAGKTASQRSSAVACPHPPPPPLDAAPTHQKFNTMLVCTCGKSRANLEVLTLSLTWLISPMALTLALAVAASEASKHT